MSAPRLSGKNPRFKRLLHGVKFIEGEFHLRCGTCWTAHRPCYWPLTLEFWNPDQGLTRCRACWSTAARLNAAKRARDHERDRRYYREAREVILLKKRLDYAAKKGKAA